LTLIKCFCKTLYSTETAAESEYDKLKAELEKSLKELESFEKNLAEGEKNKIKQKSERVKLVKNKVENQTNVLIKLLNENKKRLFKEIEANSKESSRSLNEKLNELVVPDPKRSEIKEKLSSNKYNVDQLIEVRDDIVKQNIQLYRKALKETESFERPKRPYKLCFLFTGTFRRYIS
jgi:exonuclease VII large subunit